MTAACSAAPAKPAAALVSAVVRSGADVSAAIPRLIRMEVLKRRSAAFRQRSVIAIMRIPAIIYVAIEAARTMEPRAGSDKDAANEPVRAVVPVGSAIIRRIVEVPIRAHGRHANVYGNLLRGLQGLWGI